MTRLFRNGKTSVIFTISAYHLLDLPVLMVLIHSLAGIIVVLGVLHTQEALSITQSERSCVVSEREAFDEFVQRVKCIDPSPTQQNVSQLQIDSVVEQRTTSRRLDRVRELYEETVMAVPHYESDYGEPLGESLANELGNDIAVAVLESDRLTPLLKKRLLMGARNARDRRDDLLKSLDKEHDMVAEAHCALVEITENLSAETDDIKFNSFSSLAETWERLDQYETRCHQIASERQHQIQNRTNSFVHPDADIESFHAYLYLPLEVTYPVLADTIDVLDRIREARQELLSIIDGH